MKSKYCILMVLAVILINCILYGCSEKNQNISELPDGISIKKSTIEGKENDEILVIKKLNNENYKNVQGYIKTYLNPDYYQKHLEPFEKTGCYRIQRTDPMLPDDQYGGVLGHNSGLFVTSGEDMMKALKEADGDVSKLEKIFGMDEGDWGKNPVIIRVDDPQHLRIPDGNEMGAWTKYYIPGGFTSGNQAEAVIDSVPRGEYQVMKFNNPELMNWMKKGIGE